MSINIQMDKQIIIYKYRYRNTREFLGGPLVRTLCFHCRGQVPSLGGELIACKPRGAAKKKKISFHRNTIILIHAKTGVNVKNIILRKRNQIQNSTYCIISFI